MSQVSTVPPPPGLAAAAVRLFELEWPALLWGRRGRWMLPLLAWPVLNALMHLAASGARPEWSAAFGPYLDILLPLGALFQCSRLIRRHVEDRTIVFLLARPVPRAAVVIGAFGAYLAAALAVALPALVIGFFLSTHPNGWTVEALARALLGATLALVSFGALFTLLGLILRKPLVFGLVLLFSWLVLAVSPGAFPRTTLTAPLRVVAGLPSAPLDMPLALAGAIIGVATVAALVGAVVMFRTGEYAEP